MSQKVVHFAGPDADVISPAPVESAADRGSEWSLAAACRQVPAAGMRYAHQHLTEGREASVTVQRNAWAEQVCRKTAVDPVTENVVLAVATDICDSAEPTLEVDGHRTAAAVVC